MNYFKDLHTDEARKVRKAALDAATKEIIAEMREDTKAHDGRSITARSKQRTWQYQNSNFGMGM